MQQETNAVLGLKSAILLGKLRVLAAWTWNERLRDAYAFVWLRRTRRAAWARVAADAD